MSAERLFADLVAYSAQVACLIALGGCLPGLLRVDAASVRYSYYRALLAVCLALPWLQGRPSALEPARLLAVDPVIRLATQTLSVSSSGPGAVTTPFPWVQLIAVLIATGVVARVLNPFRSGFYAVQLW